MYSGCTEGNKFFVLKESLLASQGSHFCIENSDNVLLAGDGTFSLPLKGTDLLTKRLTLTVPAPLWEQLEKSPPTEPERELEMSSITP